MAMSYLERLAVRFLLTAKFDELHEDEFEDFFQDLMVARYDDFVDVRTAGRLGDMGSDGLSLYSGKLYACYGPQVYSEDKLTKKFWGDLEKAKAKRSGQFETFVFVHNDRRGAHPKLAALLATAAANNSGLKFNNFGFRKIRDEVMRLDRPQAEDLLGTPLPVNEYAYGVGIDELKPLLDHLGRQRSRPDGLQSIEVPSALKLDYNRFSEDTRHEIVRFLHLGALIDDYYTGRVDVTERDEVAYGFREEYQRLRQEDGDEPDLILWHLEHYILGNLSAPLPQHNAAKALIAYFFQSCDVFENAPDEWTGSDQVAG